MSVSVGDTVFRMAKCKTGRWTVTKATVVGKSGSWLTLENGGGEWKENGHSNWHPTAMEAIHHYVGGLSFCYWHRHFDKEYIDELLHRAVDEAFCWGQLLGAVVGLTEDTDSRGQGGDE